MKCPKCKQAELNTTSGECPQCGFHGDAASLEELSHLGWLLGEIDRWTTTLGVSPNIVRQIRTHYISRKKKTEIGLGLRLAPFTPAEAREAWPEFLKHLALFERVRMWRVSGNVKQDVNLPTYTMRAEELRIRLEGYNRPDYLTTRREQLELTDFILAAIPALKESEAFTSPEAEQKISATLQAEKEKLETLLGMRAAPQTAEKQSLEKMLGLRDAPQGTAKAVAPAAPPPPDVPTPPATERLRRSILSERTLQALIFLGIFLLFTAAISFVISGWDDFSRELRVGIPTIFTLIFIGLGWLVRTKTALYRSGIALSAIAALFIPIDCYTIYANYGSPPNNWQAFWLLTSIFSLLMYILLTLPIQSRFFVYITAVAAGSTILAGIEIAGISRDWYSAGISALAVVMLFIASGLEGHKVAERLRVFIEPFRYLALWIPSILMPLSLGVSWVTRGFALDELHNAMTLNWFLGAFIFGWGAVRYRNRDLGRLAAIVLPVAIYMGQFALFERLGVNAAWHAFGLACLTPLYFIVGHRVSMRSLQRLDPVLAEHARTATGTGVILVVVAALYSLTDLTSGAPAATSHTILAASVALYALLWKRPQALYTASFFSATAAAFAMTEWNFKLNQLGIGWASLAILHILLALWLGRIQRGQAFISTLVVSGYMLAGAAVLPPILLYDSNTLSYTLGNFIALSAWGASFAWHRQPGFYAAPADGQKPPGFYSLLKTGAIYHWCSALPLPGWLWVTITNAPNSPGFLPVLALAALAWGMVAASYRLAFTGRACRWPWHFVGILASTAAPVAAFITVPGEYTPAITLLSAGLLYFADAFASRTSLALYPAGFVTAWGLGLLLERLNASTDAITFALCVLIGIYMLSGLFAERHKLSITGSPAADAAGFFGPLYHTVHILSVAVLGRIYAGPLLGTWTDEMQLWGAADQLVLAALYALYAWARYRETWAYIAVWLAVAGGGFLVSIYSTGQGSLAAKGALIVVALVLTERGMFALKCARTIGSRLRAFVTLAWRLYGQPLLFTGWLGSIAVIGLALVRNYLILGSGRIQQTWAAVALAMIVALYALSARLFKQARFVFFAVCLAIIPWTICANLGWFVFAAPKPTEFALSWMALAWVYFFISLVVRRYASKAYVTPLTVAARILTPFCLVWAVADVNVSIYTVGMAIALYAVAAWEDHLQNLRSAMSLPAFTATKFLYPALGLVPLWAVYWLKHLQPTALHEHFGLLLLGFGALGLLAGNLLERIALPPGKWPERKGVARAYGLPAYITGYVALTIGILLTAHMPALLAFALLYAALLMVVSAWMFKTALWIYPAAALAALSLLTALAETGVPLERRGWWLIGLAALYLGAGWLLRRFALQAYAGALISVAFMLIALGLPPSSRDRIGAFWGYSGAALLYGVSAFWFKQPLLLATACVLVVVPYASALQQSTLDPRYYGLALLPGAALSLGLGHLLDSRLGAWDSFPWDRPGQWLAAFAQRMLNWWAFPLYSLGLGLASAAPFFAGSQANVVALNFALLAVFYAWAVVRFRARFWLWACVLALHLAVYFYLLHLGFGARTHDAEFWLRFLPVTALMTVLALLVEKWFDEGSPFEDGKLSTGWSRPLYFFVAADIILAQLGSLQGSLAGTWVTLTHMALLALLASVWGAVALAYTTTGLGLVALFQWRSAEALPANSFPVHVAWLAFGYGLLGFGYRLFPGLAVRTGRQWKSQGHENEPSGPRPLSLWELPLQRSAMALSVLALLVTPILGIDLIGWTLRALLGYSIRDLVEFETIWMAVWVLSLVGLLYTAASAVYRRLHLGYLAIGMLLSAWFLYAYYINVWDNLRDAQWYALPAGLYLLAISFIEWTRGNKRLARWLDYAAMLVLMGSLFRQTLSFGLIFCLMLIVEGMLVFAFGMARRLRRYFYTGIAGVILAVLGQLVNGLQNESLWLILGGFGLLLIVVLVILERNLEGIKSWRQRVLETWE